MAQSLGLAPATFLGLTFVSWALITSIVVSGSGLLYLFARKKLQLINDERRKGGLSDTTWREILEEVQNFEKHAMIDLLEKLAKECNDIVVCRESETVEIKRVKYRIRDLKYVVEKNGAERIVKSNWIPHRRIVVFTIKEAQR